MQYLLTCRSLTYAQRGARALERAGITGTVSRAPRNVSLGGCGYCIIVSAKNRERAITVLAQAGLRPEKIFRREDDGSVQEVGQ